MAVEWKDYTVSGLKDLTDTIPTSTALIAETKVVDGDFLTEVDSYWNKNKSYGVDLGESHTVTRLRAHCNTLNSTPTSWEGPFNDSVTVYSSSDNSTWTLVELFNAPTIYDSGLRKWIFDCLLTTPTAARYWKIHADESLATNPSSANIRICEIEVFTETSTSSSSLSVSSSSLSFSSSSRSSSSSCRSSSSISSSSSSQSSSSISSSSSSCSSCSSSSSRSISSSSLSSSSISSSSSSSSSSISSSSSSRSSSSVSSSSSSRSSSSISSSSSSRSSSSISSSSSSLSSSSVSSSSSSFSSSSSCRSSSSSSFSATPLVFTQNLLMEFSEAIHKHYSLTTSIGTQTILVIPGGRGMYNRQSLLLQISDPDIGTSGLINSLSGAEIKLIQSTINAVESTHYASHIQSIIGRIGDLLANVITVEQDPHANPAITTMDIGVDILLDGGSILDQIISCSINYDESSVHNSIEILSHDNELLRRADPTLLYGESRLTVKINTRVIYFLIEDISGEEGSFTIFGRSISAKGDLPYVDNVEVSLDSPEAAEEVAESFLSESSLIWNTVSWNLPEGFEFKGSPIAGVQAIAASVGAIVRSTDDGSIQVRNLTPTRPIDMPNASPDVNYDRVDDIISANFNRGLGTGENEIEVDGEGASSNLPIIEVEDRDDTNLGIDVYLRVYWVNTKPKILDDLVTDGLLSNLGEKSKTIEDEIVAIENGEGTTKYPVYSLTSTAKIGSLSPGTISSEQYSTTLSGDDGAFAVIQATYVTKYQRYKAYRHDVVAILAAVFFDEEAGISVKIIFGEGGNAAEGISDGNLTSTEAAKQRGIAYLDANKYDFKGMDLTVPYSEDAIDGNIGYVNDAEIECTGNFAITKSEIQINGPQIINILGIKQWQVS